MVYVIWKMLYVICYIVIVGYYSIIYKSLIGKESGFCGLGLDLCSGLLILGDYV